MSDNDPAWEVAAMRAKLAFKYDCAEEAAALGHAPPCPLVLDLDGTLLRTDLLHEATLRYVKQHPLGIFMLVVWLCGGIANLKHQLARRVEFATDLLPVNERLASYARDAWESGRTVIVATAANRALASKVCGRFDFIGEILASSEKVNLKGAKKCDALKQRFPKGFTYAGDSHADVAVWRQAASGIFAGRDRNLVARLQTVTELEADFLQTAPSPRHWLKALRPHQWAKNGLVFLPFLLAGRLLDLGSWLVCASVFIAMGLTASATYIINDLFDLDADRAHWSKCNRPFAAGHIAIVPGLMASAGLLIAGLILAAVSGGWPVLGALLLYCAITLSYSLHLKRVPVLDVTVLASLFTLRLLLGAVAADVRLSSWLIVFSMFLFTSLALAKRATEIGRKTASSDAPGTPHDIATIGRGYVTADVILVTALGIATAVAAVQVMVLYLIQDAFEDALYRYPQLLWAVPVLIGLWLGRIWLLSGRELLDDDPVIFAVTDRISIFLGAGVIASFAGAALIG